MSAKAGVTRLALIVYGSMFGNTKAVAEEVVTGVPEVLPADVVEVSTAPGALADDVRLLIVGGPTTCVWHDPRHPAASFFVEGVSGPFAPLERDRAYHWASSSRRRPPGNDSESW
ncbi:flavodoxin family protein [Saccharopolyspora sp. ASAGF58]|uniref:flavodoxin family protein n=1 Tax=Saccharopolyspora sp. ASAGF58 TaxID=2719023 RepID=UPI00143FBC98|nr:flavodoxin family protein [Saccharopolyspora sp. ASAGF58]QIZ38652.1 flavodoxin family protein [Saccharopolyspora sp. ASAGF58]